MSCYRVSAEQSDNQCDCWITVWMCQCSEGDEGQPKHRTLRGSRAWVDPDDEGVRVPIAGRSRLRKLRRTEDEAVLSGIDACSASKRTPNRSRTPPSGIQRQAPPQRLVSLAHAIQHNPQNQYSNTALHQSAWLLAA